MVTGLLKLQVGVVAKGRLAALFAAAPIVGLPFLHIGYDGPEPGASVGRIAKGLVLGKPTGAPDDFSGFFGFDDIWVFLCDVGLSHWFSQGVEIFGCNRGGFLTGL